MLYWMLYHLIARIRCSLDQEGYNPPSHKGHIAGPVQTSEDSSEVRTGSGKGKTAIAELTKQLVMIPEDLIPPMASNPETMHAPRWPSANQGAETSISQTIAEQTLIIAETTEQLVSPSAPPVSTTKGTRKTVGTIAEGVPPPHFQRGKEKKKKESVVSAASMGQGIMHRHATELKRKWERHQ